MEQARYLLEKNRAHDLGSVQYYANTGKKNRVIISQYNRDFQRYNSLIAQQDWLVTQKSLVASQLAAAHYQLAILQNQPTPDQAKIQLQNDHGSPRRKPRSMMNWLPSRRRRRRNLTSQGYRWPQSLRSVSNSLSRKARKPR
jgi:hypothetical protein